MKRRFQIYKSFVENIKDNYEKLLESGLKSLNKCRFYTLANNRSWRPNTLEYEIDSQDFWTPYVIRSTMTPSFCKLELAWLSYSLC